MKILLYSFLRLLWGVFVGCSVAFFLYYLVKGDAFDISILCFTALGLFVVGCAYYIYMFVKGKNC